MIFILISSKGITVTLSIIIDNNHIQKLSQYIKHYGSFVVTVMVFMFSLSIQAIAKDDSDGDGLTDAYELKIGSESYLSDTDGDTIKDGDEVGKDQNTPLDSDNDGVINALDYDDDNDGLPTYLESKKDTDRDGLLDYLDKDSDNDGVADGEESGFLNQDKNRDGIDDAFDINRDGAVDNNGDGIDDNVKLPDHNNDGKPDYLDSNFQRLKQILVKEKVNAPKEVVAKKLDQKSVQKAKIEKIVNKKQTTKPKAVDVAKEHKTNIAKPEDMIINRHTDSDNDGLSNALEKILGTNHLSRDSDNDKVSDAIEIGLDVNAPQDSDRDGIIDALDNDDDNDGVLTKLEDLNNDSTAINDDTDGDGVPNYLDANDDGDNLPTKAEGYVLDSDGDGILNYLDKNDAVKDTSNSKNQIAKTKEINIPKEPEVVVLFDGNAAELSENDEMPIDEEESTSIQDDILTSLNIGLENDTSSDTNDEIKNESRSSKSASNKKNAWDLF